MSTILSSSGNKSKILTQDLDTLVSQLERHGNHVDSNGYRPCVVCGTAGAMKLKKGNVPLASADLTCSSTAKCPPAEIAQRIWQLVHSDFPLDVPTQVSKPPGDGGSFEPYRQDRPPRNQTEFIWFLRDMDSTELKDGQAYLLVTLASHGGKIFPSYARLGRETFTSESTARRNAHKLAANDLITIIPRTVPGKTEHDSHEFKIHFDKVCALGGVNLTSPESISWLGGVNLTPGGDVNMTPGYLQSDTRWYQSDTLKEKVKITPESKSNNQKPSMALPTLALESSNSPALFTHHSGIPKRSEGSFDPSESVPPTFKCYRQDNPDKLGYGYLRIAARGKPRPGEKEVWATQDEYDNNSRKIRRVKP